MSKIVLVKNIKLFSSSSRTTDSVVGDVPPSSEQLIMNYVTVLLKAELSKL
jgi:hypothetical protein